MHTHIIHYVLFQWCPNKSERGGPERVGVLIVGINMSTNNESKYLKSTQSTTNSQIFNSVWTLKKYIINIPSKMKPTVFMFLASTQQYTYRIPVASAFIMYHVACNLWLLVAREATADNSDQSTMKMDDTFIAWDHGTLHCEH